MDVTVVVATFGSQDWARLALERAVPSAEAQAPTIHVHGDTLAESRNAGLAQVETEWVVHLDADDELEPGYVEALGRSDADMRAPAVAYVKHGRRRRPYVPRVPGHAHACTAECLPQGNWLVVGTAVRAELLRRAGGWGDEALYEDWAAFLRCYLAGGTVEAIPDAVYRAHVRDDSRNRAPSMAEKNEWHRRIHSACFPEPAAA